MLSRIPLGRYGEADDVAYAVLYLASDESAFTTGAVHLIDQVTKQLHKLVNVIKIVEQDADNSVARELALIKVRADASTRSQVIEAVNLFRAKVVDVSNESLTIEATGTPGKLEALLRVLEPYGIRELVQSGLVSLSRGPRGIGTVK